MLKKYLLQRRKQKFLSITYKDKPGFSIPSVDDLKFEALLFEKRIKDYILNKSGALPDVSLHYLIQDHLPNYPLYPNTQDLLPNLTTQDLWFNFLEKAKLLKDYRNNIVHSDFKGLPSVSELYEKFKSANDVLLPFKFCSGDSSKFKPICWTKDVLEIEIDGGLYKLELEDIRNLTIELHPASRGRVHFIKGKVVESKVLDYNYEKITYFIENYPRFELSLDESSVLEELLNDLAFRYVLEG